MSVRAALSRWVGAALVGVFVCTPCFATDTQTPLTLSQISARAVEAKYGRADAGWRDLARNINNGWTAPAAATGTALVVSTQKGPSPLLGQVIDIGTTRTLPWSNITRAVAKSLPLISTALAVKEIADAIRCRESFSGGSECDAGTPEVTQSVYCVFNGSAPAVGNYCGATAEVAHAAMLAAFKASSVACGGTNTCFDYRTTTCDNGGLRCTYERRSAYGTNPFGPFSFFDQKWANASNQLACPAVVVNGVTLYPVKGPDGLCNTMVYSPASEDAVATKAETWGDKAKAAAIAADLINKGVGIEHDFPSFQTPAPIQGPRETTTHPDGSTTTRDTRYDFQPLPKGYEWSPTVTVKDWAPGETPTPPETTTGGTSTTGQAPKEDPITCGLPNTPPCKIDETGTASPPGDDSAQRSEGFIQGIRDCVLTPSSCLPALPDMNWAFSLPSSCQPIPLPGFAPYMTDLDICPFQPTIHDIMSIIWAAGGLFAAVGMMFKGSE